MRNTTTKFLITIFLLTASSAAFAHPGHDVSGFTAGLMHPFSGMDHLLAMVAVGLWAAQGNTGKNGRRKVWLLPATFMTMLAVGAGIAMQWQSLPLVEAGIATSVLALGLLIALAMQLPAAQHRGQRIVRPAARLCARPRAACIRRAGGICAGLPRRDGVPASRRYRGGCCHT